MRILSQIAMDFYNRNVRANLIAPRPILGAMDEQSRFLIFTFFTSITIMNQVPF